MTDITILGTGSMAKAIGGVLAAGGAKVTYIPHADAGSAPLVGDIVVLAVPHTSVDDLLTGYRDQLEGKVVVDITNPIDVETFNSLVVPAGSSKAAQIQAALPGSKVLKAFNTTFAATLASKQVGGQQTTVLIAGDDAAAKATLAAAVEAGGVAAFDAGPLARAHELEAIGFQQVLFAAADKISWAGGFALVR